MKFDDHLFVSLTGSWVYHLRVSKAPTTLCGYDVRRVQPDRIHYYSASFTQKRMEQIYGHLRPCQLCEGIQIMRDQH